MKILIDKLTLKRAKMAILEKTKRIRQQSYHTQYCEGKNLPKCVLCLRNYKVLEIPPKGKIFEFSPIIRGSECLSFIRIIKSNNSAVQKPKFQPEGLRIYAEKQKALKEAKKG